MRSQLYAVGLRVRAHDLGLGVERGQHRRRQRRQELLDGGTGSDRLIGGGQIDVAVEAQQLGAAGPQLGQIDGQRAGVVSTVHSPINRGLEQAMAQRAVGEHRGGGLGGGQHQRQQELGAVSAGGGLGGRAGDGGGAHAVEFGLGVDDDRARLHRCLQPLVELGAQLGDGPVELA